MIEDLAIILSEGESDTVEFKECADKSLPSEVCAFANASGGRVFIGVDDGGRVVGTDTSNIARSRVQDSINQIEPYLKVDIKVQGNIIVVTVPEGPHKPYSCARGFYLRSGPNSQKLERDSILEFFQSEGKVRWDEIVRHDLPIDERFNEKAYQRYLKLAGISDVLDREAVLRNLKSISWSGNKLCFTNAGALFFRINDEDVEYRHAGVVCALYKGTEKVDILDAKELNGDIVSNVDDALLFLKKHLRLSYRIQTPRRENVLELPVKALREAIVNAVCHRDYFEKGARVMVEIFDDRVDIVNPGGVCKGITPENFGSISITRNSLIASMLYRIDYIEQMGTGIKRIRKEARDAEVAEPVFGLGGFFKVTFPRISDATDKYYQQSFWPFFKVTFPRISDAQAIASEKVADTRAEAADTRTEAADTRTEAADTQAEAADTQAEAADTQAEAADTQAEAADTRTEAEDTQQKQAKRAKERKQKILVWLEERGHITVSDLGSLFSLKETRAREILSEMCQENTLEKAGKARATYYVLKKKI